MRKREVIQQTHERLLDAPSVAVAEEVMAEHHALLKLHPDSSDSHHKEFEKSRAVIQPTNSALGELAWRRVTGEMSAQYTQTGSLEREDAASYEKYAHYSPTLRRFMATMHAWLGAALQEVLDDAHAGNMPHAAVYGVMVPARARRREASEWQKQQALAEGKNWVDAPKGVDDFFKFAWGELNLPLIAGSVLGRALAVSAEIGMDRIELTLHLQNDIDRESDLSSVVNDISVPLMETSGPLLENYSLWERGEMSTEDFLTFCQTNPFCTSTELHPTLKNGRWKNPGFCAADIMVGRPESFPVSPEHFLRQLGVNDLTDITLTKLYVASANTIARDTIFTLMPR